MSSQGSPQVSVVMPAHNAGAWLLEAARSVLAQTLTDLELIVIDDGSTDGSTKQLHKLEGQDPRLRILRQARRGLVASMNHGLYAARAPLVARLDADDIAHPRRLERQAAFLARSPDVGLVGCWVQEIDSRGRCLGQRKPQTEPQALGRLLLRGNPFVHSSVMARADLMIGLGGYRRAFETAEDYDLWLRLSEVTKLANLPEMLVSYRVHDRSVSYTQGLRQSFSARLAQRAAAARRAGEADPSDGVTTPPDWRREAPPGAFYAADAALYRWLDRAGDRTCEPKDRSCGQLLTSRLGELTHVERRLAARAIVAQLRSADRAEARDANSLLLKLCREQPSTVLRAAWSLRPRAPRYVSTGKA